MKPWKRLDRQPVLSQLPWLEVFHDRVELPDGTVIEEWPWVVTPDFINVVALDEEGQYLCFRQTKYAVGDECLALVGGYLEEGEPPLEAAKREMLEELGAVSDNWTFLGRQVIDANRGCGHGHFFLAEQVRCIQAPNADDLEEQQVVRLTKAELQQALCTGRFPVAPWAAALGLALLR